MKLTPQYLAGFFDGDGCTYVSQKGNCCHVSLAQKDPIILYQVQKQFGGSIGQSKYTQVYTWKASSITAINFLKYFYKYSCIKREEIELVIIFYNLPWRQRFGKKRNEAQKEIDKKWIQTIKDLKLNYNKTKLPEQLPIEYIAGFFDAEGLIFSKYQIIRQKYKLPFTLLKFIQKETTILEKIKSQYNIGNIQTTDSTSYFEVNGIKSLPILQDILPYLKIKRQEADLMYKFLLQPWRKHFPGNGGRKRTIEQEQMDSAIIDKIRSLKKNWNKTIL